MGDKIHAGAGATVINRSTLINSLNHVEQAHGEDVAAAWRAIVDEVERSGDDTAKDLANAVSEEIQRENPKPSIIRTLFHGLVQGAPAVNNIAAAVETFTKAFGITN